MNVRENEIKTSATITYTQQQLAHTNNFSQGNCEFCLLSSSVLCIDVYLLCEPIQQQQKTHTLFSDNTFFFQPQFVLSFSGAPHFSVTPTTQASFHTGSHSFHLHRCMRACFLVVWLLPFTFVLDYVDSQLIMCGSCA